MHIADCLLKSASPYSQSKHHMTPKLNKELPDAYEERTWRERIHSNDEGNIVIPKMSFSNCIKEGAKYESRKIKGKNNATYTKHFESGIMVMDDLVLPYKKDEVEGEWLFVPSDGKRGGSKRVLKCFGLIPEWEGWVRYYVLDDIITEDVFRSTLELSGLLRGIGRYRPANMGWYGRFKVVQIKWQEASLSEAA